MDNDAIRELSTLLFGNVDRLQAAAAIGRLAGKPLSVTVVAEESGLSYNRAQEQFARFKRAKVLIPDYDAAMKRKDHRCVDIEYWRLAAALEAQLRSLDELI